jgi:hypothetical protein
MTAFEPTPSLSKLLNPTGRPHMVLDLEASKVPHVTALIFTIPISPKMGGRSSQRRFLPESIPCMSSATEPFRQ